MQFVEANGAKIPAIGLGTWELRGRTCARLVEQALKLGYRHIDTAQAYDNEREVGEGLRASRVRRDEVFVTTKVWTTHFAPNDLERSAKESLTKLRLSEVDLLLLHWPNPQVPLQETLGALARVKELVMCRHIGVSNFTVALIKATVKFETPMCLHIPSFLTRASAPNVSCNGTCGFGQCSSNRSTSERRSFVRLSLADRSRSFG